MHTFVLHQESERAWEARKRENSLKAGRQKPSSETAVSHFRPIDTLGGMRQTATELILRQLCTLVANDCWRISTLLYSPGNPLFEEINGWETKNDNFLSQWYFLQFISLIVRFAMKKNIKIIDNKIKVNTIICWFVKKYPEIFSKNSDNPDTFTYVTRNRAYKE